MDYKQINNDVKRIIEVCSGHLNWLIFYFIVISESIFKNVHKFKIPRETDDMWSICEVAKQSFIGAVLYTDYFD